MGRDDAEREYSVCSFKFLPLHKALALERTTSYPQSNFTREEENIIRSNRGAKENIWFAPSEFYPAQSAA
jgi:hypothetical protein